MKSVLITGGSSGIGLEISKHFAKNKYQLFWVSLYEEEALKAKEAIEMEFPTQSVKFLVQDLSKAEGAENVYQWIKAQPVNLDVIINNAGFATFGYAKEIPLEKEINMINLNVLSVYHLTRLFLDDMIKRDAGTIINISSNTSFQPVPLMAAYSGTKAFVKQYSQSLHHELKRLQSNVNILTVCPAAIKNTKFKKAANMENVKTFSGLAATTKEEVADDVWKAYVKRKSYLLTGAKLRRLNWLSRILPSGVVQFLIKDELSTKK